MTKDEEDTLLQELAPDYERCTFTEADMADFQWGGDFLGVCKLGILIADLPEVEGVQLKGLFGSWVLEKPDIVLWLRKRRPLN